MFDNFGFVEGIIIVLLGLVVLGPERLPALFEKIRKFRIWRMQMEAQIRDAMESIEHTDHVELDYDRSEDVPPKQD